MELTDSGEEVIREIVPNHVKYIASKTCSLTEDEKNQLIQLLDKLAICFEINK